MKKKIILAVLIGMLCVPISLSAQKEPDDIALNNDAFQDAFYESLKQKGIENYDKAITALEKCQKLEPNNATVFFELGKNYLAQRDYKRAYDSFEQATKIDPKNKWFWVGMYDVCYETRDWPQAIIIVNKLVEFKKEYEEDLVSLYMNTQQFDKALELINKLNDNVGKSDLRDSYKNQILKQSKYQRSEKDNLIAQIDKNPKDEANYIALIYLYSESNQEEKAMEVAKKLEKEIPTSDWAQVSLFKFHLNNNDGEKAVKAMNVALASKKIDPKIKHRMLNEFLIFIKDTPQFDPDLDKAIAYFDNDKDVKVAKEIAKFYDEKKIWDKAIRYYEMHLKSNSDDVEAMLLLFNDYTEKQEFDVLAKKAEAAIELFPLQPQFYYFGGLANNQLKNFKKAKDLLEMGLDYLVNDVALEINFNIQLGEAYSGLGDAKKKESYFQKAERLLNKTKK
ncbi:cytochrome c biosynthesis protein [Flavobacterium noncentrifugens]|uniref:Tetratricopeptide repeat-containing protein n=1 Tax=Flavobacterium noncentrifugens TaxID=1128970 RepID=A0A1G8T2U3_9FLAO|nr:tetratricopeptide repeat protein [Flavobacterium noncentrifugens]GEP50067.1 cytochrome c biosynthesis protein [Flavobacterium noncentrifugens]SDJ35803.1 Tetratricopeptide repeat-containing protein [Flavobacterium noncentrifugens]